MFACHCIHVSKYYNQMGHDDQDPVSTHRLEITKHWEWWRAVTSVKGQVTVLWSATSSDRVISKTNRVLHEMGYQRSRMKVAPGAEASQRGKLFSDFVLNSLMPGRHPKLSLIHSMTLQLKTSLFSPKVCTSPSFLLYSIWSAILNPSPPSCNPEAMPNHGVM